MGLLIRTVWCDPDRQRCLQNALLTNASYGTERPAGDPVCFVQMGSFSNLDYHCQWPGGTPQANLTFPQLNSASWGVGIFSLPFPASRYLDGKAVMCIANHPTEQKTCSVTASKCHRSSRLLVHKCSQMHSFTVSYSGRPVEFLPAVRSTAGPDNQTAVTISCVSPASPKALVTWSRGKETLTNGTNYQMSSDTTQLHIRDYNVSNLLLHNYSCTCFNPLGKQMGEVQLQGAVLLLLAVGTSISCCCHADVRFSFNLLVDDVKK